MSNNQVASDFCFVCESDGQDTYAVINSIESFKRDGHVDDSSEFDDVIDSFLPEELDQATDSTWYVDSDDMNADQLRQTLLAKGFVEYPSFTEYMKHNHPIV